ncbi:unnamed protein product [Cylicostephanus goldi]|uniref:Uncharacterized protein n=1 Tax=Cylicostephanus goldi TaxID=71465 RepID=A0A3P6QV08_CYLGO|nr:unnamed protein product [Cylicostephanus goldi]
MQAKQFDMESIKDASLKRQLAYVSFEGMSALSPKDYAAFNQAQNAVCKNDLKAASKVVLLTDSYPARRYIACGNEDDIACDSR